MLEPRRPLRVGLLALPILLSLAVYYRGLSAWFQQDDFAHLQLAARTSLAGLPAMLLQPVAQGTFRPFSERGFYWTFYQLFGLEAAPYRIACFLLHAGNCALLFALLRRLSGSWWGASLGVAMWGVNPCLALPLTWVAATNQGLWAASVLGSVYLFVLFGESGQPRYLAGSWVVFLSGFGMLEGQIAVPAILVAYAFLWNRARLLPACTYFVPAGLFAVLHLWLIPRKTTGAYAMDLGPGMWMSAVDYWRISWGFSAAAWIAALLLPILIWRGETRKLVCLGIVWWLALLGPVLPLQRHITDYYLTVPLMGVSAMAAAAFVIYPRLSATLGLAWICAAAPVARAKAAEQVERSRNMEALVRGVAEVSHRFPRETILLSGVNDRLFWSGIYDHPFPLVGRADVYLTPEAAAALTPYPDLFQARDYTLPSAVVTDLLDQRKAVVYTVQGRRLTQSTGIYARSRIVERGVARVDLGDPAFDRFLDTSWYGRENGFRWMPARASVTLSGEGRIVTVAGFCVPQQFRERKAIPVHAKWNGADLGTQILRAGASQYTLQFVLPLQRDLNGTLAIEVASTMKIPGDSRDLALAVTRIAIQ